jgi:hypothetical protein
MTLGEYTFASLLKIDYCFNPHTTCVRKINNCKYKLLMRFNHYILVFILFVGSVSLQSDVVAQQVWFRLTSNAKLTINQSTFLSTNNLFLNSEIQGKGVVRIASLNTASIDANGYSIYELEIEVENLNLNSSLIINNELVVVEGYLTLNDHNLILVKDAINNFISSAWVIENQKGRLIRKGVVRSTGFVSSLRNILPIYGCLHVNANDFGLAQIDLRISIISTYQIVPFNTYYEVETPPSAENTDSDLLSSSYSCYIQVEYCFFK